MITFLALGFICGCHRGSDETVKPAAPPPPAVKVVQARCGTITRSVSLPGEIRAYQQATLYAKVAGYLKTLTVDKGDRVKAGTLLAEIEVPELLAERARDQAEAKVAEIDYNRLKESQAKAPDLVMAQTVDDALGRLEMARANLKRAETLLDYARIMAPFSGVVTKRFVDPGAFIPAATSGSPASSAALLTLADFERVRVQVAVPEREASLIAKDQPVSVSVEGLPGRNFAGAITRYSYALDENTKTMLAEIELPNPNLELRPGMYALVRIGIEQKENALLVPVAALVSEKAGPLVFVLADHQAKKTPIKTGFNDGVHVEVLSGLKPEQPVILSGGRALTDGQPVSPAEEK